MADRKETKQREQQNRYEIPHPGRRPPQSIRAQSYQKKLVVVLPRGIVVGVAFSVCLRGPGRAPGFSLWSSPIWWGCLVERMGIFSISIQ